MATTKISRSPISNILELPDKLILEIFLHLDQATFLIVAGICKRWNKIVEDNIDLLSSWFAEVDENNEIDENEGTENSTNLDSTQNSIIDEETGLTYTEEQSILAQQILNFKGNRYYEMLGVGDEADEDDIRNQYKKLALLLHPDKNKAPEAQKAFQLLKKAFDAVMSGIDPDGKNTSFIKCPNTEVCDATIYIPEDKEKAIMKALDIGYCRTCKTKFGRVFCNHCFQAWTMVIDLAKENSLVECSSCHRYFAIIFPKPQPKAIHIQKQVQATSKKRKREWWQKK